MDFFEGEFIRCGKCNDLVKIPDYPRHSTNLHRLLKINCLICKNTYTKLSFKKHWPVCSKTRNFDIDKSDLIQNPNEIPDNHPNESFVDDNSGNAKDEKLTLERLVKWNRTYMSTIMYATDRLCDYSNNFAKEIACATIFELKNEINPAMNFDEINNKIEEKRIQIEAIFNLKQPKYTTKIYLISANSGSNQTGYIYPHVENVFSQLFEVGDIDIKALRCDRMRLLTSPFCKNMLKSISSVDCLEDFSKIIFLNFSIEFAIF